MNKLSRFGFAVVVAIAAAPLAAQYEEREIGGVGITVFSDENFRGENATFRQDVPDLRQFNFSDRITSLRVAPASTGRAAMLVNYQGRCQVFSGEERISAASAGRQDLLAAAPARRRRRRRRLSGPTSAEHPGRHRSLRRPLLPRQLAADAGADRKSPLSDLPRPRGERARPFGTVGALRRAEVPAVPDRGPRRRQSLEPRPEQEALLDPAGGSVPGPGGGGSYPPPYPEGARLVLFENPGYRGRSVSFDAATAIVSGSGNRARSAQVLGGTWQLCDGPRFTGRCQQISSSVPDLDQRGLAGVMSARPVRGY